MLSLEHNIICRETCYLIRLNVFDDALCSGIGLLAKYHLPLSLLPIVTIGYTV